jgi:hypothetical protein
MENVNQHKSYPRKDTTQLRIPLAELPQYCDVPGNILSISRFPIRSLLSIKISRDLGQIQTERNQNVSYN